LRATCGKSRRLDPISRDARWGCGKQFFWKKQWQVFWYAIVRLQYGK
jgi:hypothetical protein